MTNITEIFRPAFAMFLFLSAFPEVRGQSSSSSPTDDGRLTSQVTAALPSAKAETVSLMDYSMYKKGEDWSPAFKEAFVHGSSVRVPQGRYHCSEVRLSSGQSIVGEGKATVFIPLQRRLFVIEGKRGPEINVSADITDFSNVISVVNNEGLAAGDDIMIRGQRNSMLREGKAGLNYSIEWVLGRTRRSNCFFGEFDTIKDISGTKVTTKNNRIFPSYFKHDSSEPKQLGKGFLQRSTTAVCKLTLVKNVVLRNFSIEGTATCCMPIKLSYCKDCVVEDIAFATATESFDEDGKPDLSLIYGLYAWDTTVRNFQAQMSPELLATLAAKEKAYLNFSNYNLFKMVSSTNSGFEKCQANGGTHAFNITRSASASMGGGIPSVGCFIRDCVASNCIWAGVKVQQGCWNTELSGNTVTASAQGIITGGRKTTVRNNQVHTDVDFATDYYYTHLSRGGTIGIGLIEGYACDSVITNNQVSGFYSGIAIVDGYEEKNCFEEANILIENNNVSKCMRGFTLYKNPHCMSLAQNDLKIVIRNNVFASASGHSIKLGPDEHETCGVCLPDRSVGVDVSSNKFHRFGYGVKMEGSADYINVAGNLFDDSRCGVAAVGAISTPADAKMHINEKNNTFKGTPSQSQGLPPDRVTGF